MTPAEFIEFSQQVQWNRARVSAIHPRRSSVNCEAPDPEAAISIVETRARSLSIEPMVLVAEDVLQSNDTAGTHRREGACALPPRDDVQAACASPAASEPDVSNISSELERLHIHECDMVDGTEAHAGGVRRRPASILQRFSAYRKFCISYPNITHISIAHKHSNHLIIVAFNQNFSSTLLL